MITEYYTKALDAADHGDIYQNGVGEGYTVKNQDERANWFEYFTSRVMSVNGNVGVHYFSYNDAVYEDSHTGETEYSNRGLVDNEYEPYFPLLSAFNKLFSHMRHVVGLPIPE
jgi:hypothetical protein